MVKYKKGIFLSAIFCVFVLSQNVSPFEEDCPEETFEDDGESRGDSLAVLSRHRRSFGGQEPINWTLVIGNVLGPGGWTPLFCGANLDMIFRVSGYVVLGTVYNFGETKKNPDKVRQKYLTAFFGPTAIGTSLFRAIRNTMMPLIWDTGMNLVFDKHEFTQLLHKTTVKSLTGVILSMPFIQIRAFRTVNTLYFTSIGWAVFYIVWKWSIKAPIIAGKRKKRALMEIKAKEVENLLELAYHKVIGELEENGGAENIGMNNNTRSIEEPFFSNHHLDSQTNSNCLASQNETCSSTALIDKRAYGEYQYFLSFGGDQYFDIPNIMDNNFGVLGLIAHVAHFIAGQSFELVGYTTYGFMYNSFFRTEIEDQAHRKFLDTFMGPNAIASAMMGVIRNYFYTLACRVTMDLIIPQTRYGTIKTFQTLTFTVLKSQTFAEGFLHTRFFRQLFETGIDFFAFAVFWIVTKYKNTYLDPPADPPAPAATTTTASPSTGRPPQNQNKRVSYDLSNDSQPSRYRPITYTTIERNPTEYRPIYQPSNERHPAFAPEALDSYEDKLDTYYQQYIRPNRHPREGSWKGLDLSPTSSSSSSQWVV